MDVKKDKYFRAKLIVAIVLAAAVIAGICIGLFGGSNKVSRELTVDEAQTLVDDTFNNIPKGTALGAVSIMDNTDITVKNVTAGNEKNLLLDCTYTTYDVEGILSPKLNELFSDVYGMYIENNKAGKKTNATKVNLYVREDINEMLVSDGSKISGSIELIAYEVSEGEFQIYLSNDAVNTCTGGLLNVINTISNTTTVNYGGETVDIKNITTLRTGIIDSISLNNYSNTKPYTGTALQKFLADFRDDFYRNFIQDSRWKYLVNGLGTTLAMTGLSALLGIFLGFLVAVVRCTNQSTGKLKTVNAVCRMYLSVIRGTPLMVQLLIIYFVILLPIGVPKFISAVLCFGLNSGAYVAEIVRGGIMSVDKGQMEAGRSLGVNYSQTMINFIIPQAFKAVLPALANEFITLLKESSVAFYIGVSDLTKGGLTIRSLTFSNFMPLIAVALIYLVLVLILTYLVGILERRLRKSDH